jgi:hypothetical protein
MNGNTCHTSSTGSTLSFPSAHFYPLLYLFTSRYVVYALKRLPITRDLYSWLFDHIGLFVVSYSLWKYIKSAPVLVLLRFLCLQC